MRNLKRSIAKSIMKDRGYTKINKKRRVEGRSGKTIKLSFFGAHWRNARELKDLNRGRDRNKKKAAKKGV